MMPAVATQVSGLATDWDEGDLALPFECAKHAYHPPFPRTVRIALSRVYDE